MEVVVLPIAKIVVPDDNVRDDLGDLKELADSIKAQGLLEPVLVRDEDHVLVCGFRRVAAAKLAKLKEVPAVLRPFTEQERLETMIVENVQRASLTPLEEAHAFKRLGEFGLKQTDVAKRTGCSQSHVQKRLSLLALPEEVQERVGKAEVSLEVANELSKLKDDPATVRRLAKKAAETGKLDWEVEAELKKRQKVKDLAKARKELKAEAGDVTVIDVEMQDQYGHTLVWPDGTAAVAAQAWKARDSYVVMDEEEHAKLPCHALAVHPFTLESIEMCSDPDSHPSPVSLMDEENERIEAERAKAVEVEMKATEARMAFIRGLLARPRKNLLTDVAWLKLYHYRFGYGTSPGSRSVTYAASYILELVTGEEQDTGQDFLEELIVPYVGESKTNARRAVLALHFAALESEADYGSRGHRYFSFLAAEGYELTEFEQKVVEDGEAAATAQAVVDAQILAEEEEELGVEAGDPVDLMQALRDVVGREGEGDEDEPEVEEVEA